MLYASNIIREKGKELSIKTVEEISEAEFIELMNTFDYMHETQPMKSAYEIMIRNANEFLINISDKMLYERYFLKRESEIEIAIDANRLISNFCASFQTFIDYAKKAISRLEKKSIEYFTKYLNNMFDNEFTYRFFYKLRNYCMHFSFPYSRIIVSAPDSISLCCDKKHLIEYDGWGAIVSKDFTSLPEEIDLRIYINHFLVLLTSILLNVYLLYGNEIFNANKAIASFKERHHLSSPTILKVNSDGSQEICPIPIDIVVSDMKRLEHHPNVNISYVQQVSDMHLNTQQE